jgi:hypothetical protein
VRRPAALRAVAQRYKLRRRVVRLNGESGRERVFLRRPRDMQAVDGSDLRALQVRTRGYRLRENVLGEHRLRRAAMRRQLLRHGGQRLDVHVGIPVHERALRRRLLLRQRVQRLVSGLRRRRVAGHMLHRPVRAAARHAGVCRIRHVSGKLQRIEHDLQLSHRGVRGPDLLRRHGVAVVVMQRSRRLRRAVHDVVRRLRVQRDRVLHQLLGRRAMWDVDTVLQREHVLGEGPAGSLVLDRDPVRHGLLRE